MLTPCSLAEQVQKCFQREHIELEQIREDYVENKRRIYMNIVAPAKVPYGGTIFALQNVRRFGTPTYRITDRNDGCVGYLHSIIEGLHDDVVISHTSDLQPDVKEHWVRADMKAKEARSAMVKDYLEYLLQEENNE